MYDRYDHEEKPTEVTYYPTDDGGSNNKKPRKNNAAVKAIGMILLCAAISVGSVSAYKAVEENSTENTTKSDNSASAETKISESSSDSAKSLIELASKENALSIPDIYKKITPSVVGITSAVSGGTQTGTGIIISEDGYIITNAHVVDGANQVTALLNDGTQIGAVIVGSDSQTDIAVLKINKTGLTKAEFGNSDDLEVGELAIAIGNPLGEQFTNSTTAGIISALNREVTIEDKQLSLIQTDAAINNGNSGGPLVNSYGLVIGITSAKISTEFAEGMGFAIPINNTIPIVNDLIQNGYVTGRPLIGITGENIDSMMSKFYQIPEGIYVRSVSSGSPAQKAGVMAGDVIIGINDKDIKTMSELNEIKDDYKPGDTITLKLYRNNTEMTVSVVLGEATN